MGPNWSLCFTNDNPRRLDPGKDAGSITILVLCGSYWFSDTLADYVQGMDTGGRLVRI